MTTESTELTDEEVIASGLSFIRTGILSGEWDKVVNGYKIITDEDLPVPNIKSVKSKLEKIRELVNNKKDSNKLDDLTVKQLKERLNEEGASSVEVNKYKKKEDLLNFAKTFTQKKLDDILPVTTSKVQDANFIDDDEKVLKVAVNQLEKTKVKGQGFRSSNDEPIQIIADAFDPELNNSNQKFARKNRTTNYVRSSPPRDNSNDEDAPSRYHDKPKMKPSWR